MKGEKQMVDTIVKIADGFLFGIGIGLAFLLFHVVNLHPLICS